MLSTPLAKSNPRNRIPLRTAVTAHGKFHPRIYSTKVVKSNGRTANPIPPTRRVPAITHPLILWNPESIQMTFEIPRIEDEFTPWLNILVEHGFKNKPFILGETFSSSWLARKEWVLPDGQPNKEYLKQAYGNSLVPILMNGSDYKSTTLTEFLENMRDPKVYLKDWHFQNQFGTSVYKLHPFFSRDFVNCEKWTTEKSKNPFGDDYRFVYIGAAESWTKFHADVVSSYSWSANICGRKKWFMMPPGKEHFFKCNFSESGFVEDIRDFPNLFEQAEVVTFIQEPGEIVFVPSNWYHQVHNLADTISINHNWMNSTNLHIVHKFLNQRKHDVKHELRDCLDSFQKNEFDEKVEELLFIDARLNISKFLQLCELVKESRSKSQHEYLCKVHSSDMCVRN
ncbi:hypothetical protein GCK72_010492 [Caenorhabditis remanei]|uniref:Jumonji domain-containing protein 4 n=1 Tax=Caenorhabditis remanei TaxID=31234 RepID=A0A6A5H311_CAERE|nr:hypothetical protein GCK72_010492 [Caenorhabditis remanei]KAF1762230.1 hypothetical protein GCK72_010492 [Caenorhabditis remanei]